MALRTKRPTGNVTREVTLAVEAYDVYAERAIKAGRAVEDEMERTLSRCRSHNATQGIYLNDDDRNTLSQLSGTAVRTPEDVVKLVSELVTIRVHGVDVPLHHQLLKRLDSRRYGSTLDELVRRVVIESLEQYVGLR